MTFSKKRISRSGSGLVYAHEFLAEDISEDGKLTLVDHDYHGNNIKVELPVPYVSVRDSNTVTTNPGPFFPVSISHTASDSGGVGIPPFTLDNPTKLNGETRERLKSPSAAPAYSDSIGM